MSDDRIMQALARLEAGQQSLAAQLTQARADIMERIDRLQDQFRTLRDDGFVSMQTAYHAEDTVRREVANLAEIVAALHRMVHKIDGRLAALEDKQ
jgi:isopropylmalate/homocitrate/citramalate synthase